MLVTRGTHPPHPEGRGSARASKGTRIEARTSSSLGLFLDLAELSHALLDAGTDGTLENVLREERESAWARNESGLRRAYMAGADLGVVVEVATVVFSFLLGAHDELRRRDVELLLLEEKMSAPDCRSLLADRRAHV